MLDWDLVERPLDIKFTLALLTELLKSCRREIDIVLTTTLASINNLDSDGLVTGLDLDLLTTVLVLHEMFAQSSNHVVVISVVTTRGLTRLLDRVESGSTGIRGATRLNNGSLRDNSESGQQGGGDQNESVGVEHV